MRRPTGIRADQLPIVLIAVTAPGPEVAEAADSGVIQATLEQLQGPTGRSSRNVHSIVNRVRPSVEGLLETGLRYDHDALVHHAVRANVRASADHLRHGSQVIEQLIQTEGLVVVGAEYSLETGIVDFFDGVPE